MEDPKQNPPAKTIVHISGDYPDIMNPHKTKAVKNLVDGAPEYEHVIYSINRVDGLAGIASLSFGTNQTAIAFKALPKGLRWKDSLRGLARWIAADLRRNGIAPDLIEGHKLTIEGMIAIDLSNEFNCPYICDIQGYTDVKILKAKSGYRQDYKQIADNASALLLYSPWTLPHLENYLAVDKSKCIFLPVVPGVDEMQASSVVAERRLVSVFHLDGWENKNIIGMASAIKKVNEKGSRTTLDVYGSGSAETVIKLRDFLVKNRFEDYVSLKGPVLNSGITDVLNSYAGFVLPSKNESFGLVYVEALFAGLPVLLNKDRGISGYFEFDKIGYGCDAFDVDDIARGMEYLLDNQAELKKGIRALQTTGQLDIFRRENILAKYKQALESSLIKTDRK